MLGSETPRERRIAFGKCNLNQTTPRVLPRALVAVCGHAQSTDRAGDFITRSAGGRIHADRRAIELRAEPRMRRLEAVTLAQAGAQSEAGQGSECEVHDDKTRPVRVLLMLIEAALWAIALAAPAGLRVFMPFVFLGGMARYANLPTPGMLDWTATDAGFLFLVV